MGLFRHALQVCTIAYVSIAINGHVMLAVNVEDFRNLANKFLSKDLADRLTNLVSEISLERRIENQQRLDKILLDKEKPLKEFARTIQQPTDTTEAVTGDYNPKRFRTVTNSNSKELLREVIYNTPSGPIYVRDEIGDLLQNNSDNDNGRKKVYHPERLGERDYNTVSKEATRPLNLVNMSRDTHNKIDYTETKLGEWKYNHDISTEPPKIKNIKTGNAHRDINDEDSTDDDGAKMHELNVQYVEETRLLGRHKNKTDVKVKDHPVDKEDTFDQHTVYTKPKDSILRKPHKEPIDNISMPKKQLLVPQTKISTTEDDNHIFEEHTLELGKKIKIYHENASQKQYEVTISKNIKEVKKHSAKSKMSLNDFIKDSREVEEHKSREKETHQIPPPMKPIEINDMYEKYALGSEIENNNKKGVNHQSVEDSTEKQDRETSKIQNEDDDSDQSGNNEQSILRNKKKYLNLKVPQNSEENSKILQPKQLSTLRFLHYDEDKFDSDKSKEESTVNPKKAKQQVHERYEASTEETKEKIKERKADIGKNKAQISKEENDKYEKFEFRPENKKHNKQKPKHQADVSNENKKENLDIDDEQYVQDKHNNSYKAPLPAPLKNKKRFKDSEYCKQNRNSRLCREKELTTKTALKESAEVSRPHSVKGKKEIFSDHVLSIKIKDQQVNESDKYDLINGAKQKNTHKRRPQKKVEENDIYDKYELSGETKNDNDRKVRKKKEDRDIKTMDGKNKLNDQGRHEKQSANSEEVPINNKKKPQKKIEENDMYDKHELGRETDNDDKGKRKQKHNSDNIKAADDKNKFKNQGRNKDKSENSKEKRIRKPQKILQQNMYDKYELGRGTDNDDKGKRKQKHNSDDIKTADSKNNKNQGRNKDKSANSKEKRIRKPQKIIEQNDMYDKYELGRETDTDDKINRKNKNNHSKIIHDQNTFNYQGRNKDKSANDEKMPIKRIRKPQKIIKENDIYDKYGLDRETDNDDKLNRKEKENGDHIKTMDDKNQFNYQGRNKHKSANNEEMPIKSKNRHKTIKDTTANEHKEIQKGQGQIEKAPIAGYADDPQPDFKEVKPESIKAKTESLLDSEEPKRKGRPTKKFTMKGTIVPKRDFYKLSSPDYYKDLPRVVDKYDFEEPIPEQDRLRDKVGYLKREPSMVNKKIKLPKYEKT